MPKRTVQDVIDNPIPGDTVRVGKETRIVTKSGSALWCDREGGSWVAPWLSQWRRWAAKGEVLKIAKVKADA